MAFNYYFAGAQFQEADDFIIEKGNRLRLLSYYSEKRAIESWIERGVPLFLDSGAFSAHTKGVEIDVDEYIEYINERDEYLTCYAQLDTIPGEFGKPKTKEQLEEAPEKTWQNYLYMVERVKSPEKLIPVFHQGEDFKHLIRMLEHKPRIEYIGISPANDVSTPRKEAWIRECFKIIKQSSNPNVKTHAFGMTSLPVLKRFPFYSADSTSWIKMGSTGRIITKYGNLLVSNVQIKHKDHVSNLPEPMQKEIIEYLDGFGYSLEELGEDYRKRIMFNLMYLTEWAKNFELEKPTTKQKTLF